MNAELLSVQVTDSIDELSKYPDYRYDLITCCWNDEDQSKRLNPHHPKPKDLQFGRDDIAAGIFKWKLWDGEVAEFYRLDDDSFSIDVKMVNDYNSRCQAENKNVNPWTKNFKKITKCLVTCMTTKHTELKMHTLQ